MAYLVIFKKSRMPASKTHYSWAWIEAGIEHLFD
jgi:hypothetical protein